LQGFKREISFDQGVPKTDPLYLHVPKRIVTRNTGDNINTKAGSEADDMSSPNVVTSASSVHLSRVAVKDAQAKEQEELEANRLQHRMDVIIEVGSWHLYCSAISAVVAELKLMLVDAARRTAFAELKLIEC
jgi:hypothetical protein